MMNIFKKLESMSRRYNMILIVAIISIHGYTQDRANYNLYNLYHPLLNPASIGGFDQLNAMLLFNYQMTGFDGAPINLVGDVSIPLGKSNSLIGIQIQHDRIGHRNRTQFGVTYAYRIKLNLKNYLSFGITALGQNMNINWQDAQNVNINDPLLAAGNQQLWSPDFRLGTYYFSERAYAGFSVGNIFNFNSNGDISVDINDIHFYLQGGVNVPMGMWKFQPSALLKYVHGSPLQIDVNTQFLYNDLVGFGLSYRTLNNLLVQFNFNIAQTVRIGYGFNMGLGLRNDIFYTGHEVMLIYTAKNNKRNIGVKCPRF